LNSAIDKALVLMICIIFASIENLSMRYFIGFTIFFLLSGPTFTDAQRMYKTGSGQKFLLQDDGQWTYDKSDEISGLSPDNDNDPATLVLNKTIENEIMTYIAWIKVNNALAVNTMDIKQTDPINDPVRYAYLQEIIKSLKSQEKELLINYGRSTQLVNRAKGITGLPEKKQQKEINEISKILKINVPGKVEKKADIKPEPKNIPATTDTPLIPAKDLSSQWQESSDEQLNETMPESLDTLTDTVKEAPAASPSSDRPSMKDVVKASKNKISDCAVQSESYDPITKMKSSVLEKDFLFNYTPDNLKNYFKTKDYLICRAGVSKTGKSTRLNLEMVFSSKDAARSYGFVPDESLVTIQMVTGKLLRLKTKGESRSSIEQYTGNILYKLEIALDKDALDALERIPLDKIGVMWSSGFERYEVFEVDFFMKQLKCIKKLI
jgi:hypothetical protein